jgi:hypothetical protein
MRIPAQESICATVFVNVFTYVGNFVEKNLSLECNRSSANKEIPRSLWNAKVHHRIQKSPTPVHT